MEELGDFALKTIKARVGRAIGSNDSPMPPLSGKTRPIMVNGKFVRQAVGYAGWKSAHGLNPIRDLTGPGIDGHMLDNLTVRSVSGSRVIMAITARKARIKALANEKRSPWMSFSDNDTRLIVKFFSQFTGYAVQAIAGKLRRTWTRAA